MTDYCDVATVRRYTSVNAIDIGDSDIESFIEEASAEIDKKCGNPREIRNEIHRADGKTFRFKLGGRTEPKTNITELLRVYLRGTSVYGGSTENMINPTYPRDTDEWTSSTSAWGSTNATVSENSTEYRCGDSSIKVAITSGTGNASYPSTQDLNVLASDWNYFFFHYHSSVSSAITVRLFEDASNYAVYSFAPSYANSWQWVFLDIGDPDSEVGDFTTLNYIEFEYTGALTLYIDGMCLSDGYALENPSDGAGYVIFQEEPLVGFIVDYFFNPFSPVPMEVRMACANLVASYIFERLSGSRLKETSGRIRIDTMDAVRDEFRGLSGQAWRHRQTAMDILRSIGFDYRTYYVDEEL